MRQLDPVRESYKPAGLCTQANAPGSVPTRKTARPSSVSVNH